MLQIRETQEPKKVMDSTNEYLFNKKLGPTWKVFALIVSAFQLGCLIFIALTNSNVGQLIGWKNQIGVYLFVLPAVSLYMSILLAETLSDIFYVQLADLHDHTICPGCCFGSGCYSALFEKIIAVYLCVLIFLLELIFQREMVNLAIVIELILLFATAVTTCIVLCNQPDPLSILFNFAGIMVVLDFDNKIASVIDFSKYKPVLRIENEPEEKKYVNVYRFDYHPKTLVIVCILIPVILYIYLNLLL